MSKCEKRRAFFRGMICGLASLTFTAQPAVAEEAPAAAPAPERPTYEQVRPLLDTYCYACHSNKKAKGDLNLERFENEDQIVQELALWARAEGRMAAMEMPPKTRPQPTEAERATMNAWFAAIKDAGPDCNRLVSEGTTDWYPGYVMSRRLNRFEYENTLRDLLGVEIKVAQRFPADGAGGEGFDTDGSALFLSAIQAEKYLEAADLAIEAALPDAAPAEGDVVSAAYVSGLPFDPFAPARRSVLIPVRPSESISREQAARASLTRFLERAWRRPVRPVEAGHVLALALKAMEQGEDFDRAIKLSYKAALVSPNFLFLAEPKPAENGVYQLGDYQLASRLSYFLWSSMPDAELFALAKSGQLNDEGQLQRQIERMLLDPKALALGEQFAAQWLGIYQLGETIKLDANRFPEFDGTLTAAMRQEAAQFFQGIFAENRSLLELIDADYTYANEALARIYGINGVSGSQLQRVKLADARRGGVLGMSAVLAATSQPLRTSPVLRGKWVLEQLLGDRVPPPPPNVPALPAEEKHADGLTLRQRLEAHRSNPDCAGCHARMDPLGFGLENFDPIGRWRDETGGQPVDARGELPSGEAFNGPAELKQILLARKDDFARNLSRKMLGYALGRSLTQYDDCVVNSSITALQNSGYQAQTLISHIVMSYPFRHRYSAAGS